MKALENVLKEMDLEFCGKGKHKISMKDLLNCKNPVFLDIRTFEEIKAVHFTLDGYSIETVEMPANTIPDNIGSIPLSKDIGIFCSGGVRAGIVYAYLKALGYNCWIIEGGFDSVLEVVKPGFVFKNTK